jgi:pimeloyl-ACP methyl ester carboxylesterase
LGACGSDDGTASSDTTVSDVTTTSTVDTTTTTTSGTKAIRDLVDIGGGRRLFLMCQGTGSPTILLESGDESGSEEWGRVFVDLSKETRTCAYDRVGTGRSSEATGCRGMDDLQGDLDALLDAAAIEGPYVLVGASGGGFLMAERAARHPEQVAGLVFVEVPKAITIVPPEIVDLIKCDHPANVEHRDYYAVEHAAWDDRARIGDFPMTIISNDYGPDGGEGDEATNVVDQQGWLVLSPQAKQVVVTGGHDVTSNDPDLVLQEILSVLEAARTG